MKTFQEFLEEAYLILEKKKPLDKTFGFDRRPIEGHEIISNKLSTEIRNPSTGITYNISHYEPNSPFFPLEGKAKKVHGHKPVHDVTWSHNKEPDKMSKKEKFEVVRNATKMWNKHIKNMIPSGHLVSNSPEENYDENRRNPNKNTRSSIYKRYKFGNIDKRTGVQYSAKIGKSFHPIEPDK